MCFSQLHENSNEKYFPCLKKMMNFEKNKTHPTITSELKSFHLSQKWNPWAISLTSIPNYFVWKCWCSEPWVLQDKYPVTPGFHFPLESWLPHFYLKDQLPALLQCSGSTRREVFVSMGLWLGRLPGLQRRVGAWRTGIKSHREGLGRKILTKNNFPLKIACSGKGIVIFTHPAGAPMEHRLLSCQLSPLPFSLC